MLLGVTALRQLPGYVLAHVYLVTSVVAPSVLSCHGHESSHAGAFEADVTLCSGHTCCGAPKSLAPAETGAVDDAHDPCHTLGDGSHTRPADDLVAAESGSLPDLPPVTLTALLPVQTLVWRGAGSGLGRPVARGPPPRPPLVQRPATLLL